MSKSRFEQGETVKAFVKLGSQREAKWQKVEYVKKSGKWFVVQFHEQTVTVPDRHIRKWQPLPEGKLDEFAAANFNELRVLVEDAAKKLLPPEWQKIEIQKDDWIVSLLDGTVTVGPAIIEKEAIGAFIEVPGWEVTVWREVPATRWEPADVSDASAGTRENTVAAASLTIDTVWKYHSDNYWQCVGESKMFEEMERDELEAQKALVESQD